MAHPPSQSVAVFHLRGICGLHAAQPLQPVPRADRGCHLLPDLVCRFHVSVHQHLHGQERGQRHFHGFSGNSDSALPAGDVLSCAGDGKCGQTLCQGGVKPLGRAHWCQLHDGPPQCTGHLCLLLLYFLCCDLHHRLQAARESGLCQHVIPGNRAQCKPQRAAGFVFLAAGSSCAVCAAPLSPDEFPEHIQRDYPSGHHHRPAAYRPAKFPVQQRR